MSDFDAIPFALPAPPPTAEPVERVSAFRRVPWHWADAAIGLVPVVGVFWGSFLARKMALPEAIPWSLAGLCFAWMLAYPLWVGRRRGVRLPAALPWRKALAEMLLALPTLVALWFFLGAAILVLKQLVRDAPLPIERFDELPSAPNGAAKLGLIVLIVLVGPVAEEVFFRGLIYNSLRRYLPVSMAAVFQALLFGLGHPFGTVYIGAASLLGLAFALVYEWRKTLWTPILLHILQNSVALAVTFAMAPTPDSPHLGIAGLSEEAGCRITAVEPGSAAEDAGLRVGDLITSVDSQPVHAAREIALRVRWKKVGDPLFLEVRRDEAVLTVRAILKRRGE